MSLKLCLRPNLSQIHPTNGIGRVLGAQYKYLPRFDVEIVERDADLYVGHTHIGDMPRIDVLQVHGFYWLGDPDSGEYGQFHINANDAIIEAARKAAIVTVPSHWVGECLRRDMRIEPVVIGHGIDFAEWEPSAERSNGHYALYAKNRVFDVCRPDAPYELARRGLPIVSTFGLDDRPLPKAMTVIGRQDSASMNKWLREADVYLATTKETFGIQTLEAMACAVPVVGWDYGGTAEIVTSGYDGLLVKYGDYDALYNAVNEAYARREEFGAHARETAREYDWVKIVERYADLFKETAQTLQHEPDGVSIVITTHNYAQYVGEAIESALAQTVPAEVIVIDDGSTDNTLEVLSIYRKIKVITQENRGVAAARTVGISAATQPYIVCLDADDKLDPHYLETMLPAIRGAREVGIVYSNLTLFNDDGTARVANGFPPEFDWEAQAAPGNPPNNCIPSAALFRREMWRRAGPHKQEYAPGEDAEFWTRGLSVGFTARKVTNAGLIWYRLHGDSASRHLKYRPIDDRLPWMRDRRYPLAAPSKYAPLVMSYSDPKVSIIVAVDEATIKHLPDTIDSITGQTMRDWELISVENDANGIGLERYPFVRWAAIKGSDARLFAKGLEMARGAFVLFMRSGDMLTNSALEEMLRAHINSGGRYIYTDTLRLLADGTAQPETAADWAQKIWQKPLHSPVALVPTPWARKTGVSTNSRAPLTDFYSRLALGGFCGQHLGRALVIVRDNQTEKALSPKRLKELEQIKMGTCCGGNGDVILAAKAALAGIVANPVEAGKVRLEYVADNVGAISFFGKNNVVYRGGKNDINRFIDAQEVDASFLLSTGKWRKALNVISLAPPAPKVEAAPVEAKVDPPKPNGNGREVEKPLPIEDEMTPEQEAMLNEQINAQLGTTKKARRKK